MRVVRTRKGIILPFEQCSITFNDVKYSVDMPQEMREQGVDENRLLLLKGVSGAFRPGVLTALMGVSGAGKTTLMDVLAAYYEQNDIHYPLVTVYESLLYSAWLRLATDVDEKTRQSSLPEVMDLVEMIPVKGCTRLDARTAAIVMRTVRNTVDTGRTVVCTIHQPSIDIFEAFDELFLMKRGGQELYVGPVGRHSCELIKYFEGIDGVSKIKDGYNPATWMLEVSTSSQELALGVDFTQIYHNSDLYRQNKALIAELSVPRPGTKDLYFPTQYSQPFVVSNAIRLVYESSWSTQRDLGNLYGVNVCSSPVSLESTFAFLMQPVLVEIPYILAQTGVYSIIVYAMIGFEWTAAKFFWYCFFQFSCLLYMTYYGMMTVAITPNANIAAIIAASFYGLFNLFSGFIIPRPRIPVWWRWYYWGNPLAWTIYGMVASQFGDFDDLLMTGESVKGYLDRYYGYKHSFLGAVAGVHVGLVLFFAFIFAYSIRSFNFQKR
ncbi:pleiotropic drug resistance protein 1-like protein [Tanacetum coccineum]